MEDIAGKQGRAAEPVRLTPAQIVLVIVMMLFLAVTLIYPLRAWSEQRTLLAESKANIARLEARQAELTARIDQAQDEAWVREQARLRLGLTEPGETPFRLVDPGMRGQELNEPGLEAAPEEEQWWELLWASIARPPAPAD